MFLETLFDEDFREHPEWKKYVTPHSYFNYIDLEFSNDRCGLVHNGSEKSNDLHETINLVTNIMRDNGFPEFELTGSMLCQGEEIGDIWRLKMIDGVAYQQPIEIEGKYVTCPDCGHQFHTD